VNPIFYKIFPSPTLKWSDTELASLSIEAHLSYSDEKVIADINQRIDELLTLRRSSVNLVDGE
jgi:hypothetical protein